MVILCCNNAVYGGRLSPSAAITSLCLFQNDVIAAEDTLKHSEQRYCNRGSADGPEAPHGHPAGHLTGYPVGCPRTHIFPAVVTGDAAVTTRGFGRNGGWETVRRQRVLAARAGPTAGTAESSSTGPGTTPSSNNPDTPDAQEQGQHREQEVSMLGYTHHRQKRHLTKEHAHDHRQPRRNRLDPG